MRRCVSKTNIVMNWIGLCVCVAQRWTICEDIPKAIPPFPESTAPCLAFPDPLKWTHPHLRPLSSPAKHCRGIGHVSLHNPFLLRSHQTWVGVTPFLQKLLWTAAKRTSLRCRPEWYWSHSHKNTTPHLHSSYKSLNRAPNSNVWQHHQYWCGRKFLQSLLSQRTLILIVLCSSRDAWCVSEMVIASGLGGLEANIIAEYRHSCSAAVRTVGRGAYCALVCNLTNPGKTGLRSVRTPIHLAWVFQGTLVSKTGPEGLRY